MPSRLISRALPGFQLSRALPSSFSSRRLYASETAIPSTSAPATATKQPTSIPRNLLKPRAKVTKRPHKERPPNPGLGARVPKAPNPEISQPVYMPNFKLTLCRNSPAHEHDPFTATFRVPKSLSKPDIVAFLTQVYGLRIIGIRTMIYQGEVVKMFHPGISAKKGPARKPGYKKAVIQMDQPFWYPERPSHKELDENFSIEEHEILFRKRQIRIGNMESKNFDRRSPSFRGSSDRFIGVGTRTNRTKESIGQQRTKQEERIHKEAQKQLEHLEQRFGQTTLQEGEEAQRS